MELCWKDCENGFLAQIDGDAGLAVAVKEGLCFALVCPLGKPFTPSLVVLLRRIEQ